MIIFNISAVIILFLIISLNYFLSLFFPDFFNLDNPFFWLTFFSIAGITEITKFKGRIFWIPLWVIGFFGYIKTFINDYQRNESFMSLFILIGILLTAILIVKRLNTKKWNNAKVDLLELSHLESDFSNSKFRSHFKSAFFVPQYLIPDNNLQHMVFGRIYSNLYTKWFAKSERNTHYLKLIEILRKTISIDLYKSKVSVFHSRLLKLKDCKEAIIEEYMLKNIHKLIDEN